MIRKGGFPLRASIDVPFCDPRLKDLAGKEADKRGIPLSEFVVQVLAEFLARPDLAAIPRKRMGRPRKAIPA
jgi:hypothetical protein